MLEALRHAVGLSASCLRCGPALVTLGTSAPWQHSITTRYAAGTTPPPPPRAQQTARKVRQTPCTLCSLCAAPLLRLVLPLSQSTSAQALAAAGEAPHPCDAARSAFQALLASPPDTPTRQCITVLGSASGAWVDTGPTMATVGDRASTSVVVVAAPGL